MTEDTNTTEKRMNFIEEIIEEDLRTGKHNTVLTRFPPEPNGYLHIGHAKSICLNFGLGVKYGGKTNLRFDDTNPTKEDIEYVESIKEDIKWLGFDWAEELYTSDYFGDLYNMAVDLIQKGLAYVDESSPEEIAALKGTPTVPGENSPFRERSIAENLDLFSRMKNGEFAEGSKVLRAKINMASPNMHMRDPLLYRIKLAAHHRTGNEWCIYPMYDFAHGQSDAIEKITHSICTLEFIPHRELYDWLIEKLELYPSKQYEFARLNLNYTVMSKRKLLELVEGQFVTGWDDPRMPTLSGIRRRGYTPDAIRNFCDEIGVLKRNGLTDIALLEFHVKNHLNKIAQRRMVVFDPIKVVITNFEEGKVEWLKSENNPENESDGERDIPFSRNLYIERDDFMENAPKKFFRLDIGKFVRLKSAYIITCNEVIKDADGNITELHCTYFPDSKSGEDTSGIKAKGTLHWVSIDQAIPVEVRKYDRLFKVENPSTKDGDFKDHINENSLSIIPQAFAEPALADAGLVDRFQFLRMGYFCLDKDSTKENLIFNRTVSLRDNWAKGNK
ncbi:MAG: glutamine--tRNA ligase/YqeY domain fusion protein [Chitinophagales bacterium]